MQQHSYQLRISRRARRLRIDVSARRGVVVVVPEGTPREIVDRFIAAKQGWIAEARDRVAASGVQLAAPEETLPSRLELRALEEAYDVRYGSDGAARIVRRGSELQVPASGDEPAVRASLTHWLKRRARRRLVPWLESHATATGLRFDKASVRGQRTRWASCSGRGTISLNYKLLFLPPNLVDHVMLHELAHTRHLNHSPDFWALLARLDPDWRAHHAALTDAIRCVPAWVEMD